MIESGHPYVSDPWYNPFEGRITMSYMLHYMLYNFYDYELGMMTEESLTKSVNLMGFATLEEAGLEYD